MDRARWPDLAQDALRHIAGRLHDAGDLVRFHAICRSWRDSRDAATASTTLSIRPWLLPESADKDSTPLEFRSIFSKSTYRAPWPSTHRGNWVCRADGTAIRYLTVEQPCPSLHDPLTGDVTHLPPFLDGQWEEEENPHGVLYADGTVLLYMKHDSRSNYTTRFRAMLLRPGDAEWTVVERTLEIPGHGSFCVAYHDGKILVTMGGSLWRIITPNVDVAHDVLVQKEWVRGEDGWSGWGEHYNYVVVSRGELLWALVWVYTYYGCYGSGRKIQVAVYALEEKARWVKREGFSLKDRVFFLGSPNSFAMDASMSGGDGGSLYFAYCNSKALPDVQFGVLKYNLNGEGTKYRYYNSEKAQLVERLPQGWGDVKCTWLVPQPHIVSIQEIRKRLLEARELKRHRTALVATSPNILRHCTPSLKLMVRNLPVTVNSFQLQLFFSKHGKVSDAKILY